MECLFCTFLFVWYIQICTYYKYKRICSVFILFRVTVILENIMWFRKTCESILLHTISKVSTAQISIFQLSVYFDAQVLKSIFHEFHKKCEGGAKRKKKVQIIQNQNYALIFIKALSYLLYIQQMFFYDISNIKCPPKTIIEIFIISFFSILFFLVKFVKIQIFIIYILYPMSYN